MYNIFSFPLAPCEMGWGGGGCGGRGGEGDHYEGHFEQPHSTVVSSSSEKEEPSEHLKLTFRLRLLVGAQQSPGWHERWHSTRGTLLVDVHVFWPMWRLSCSRTISPWHVSSGRRRADVWELQMHEMNIVKTCTVRPSSMTLNPELFQDVMSGRILIET